MDSPFKYWRLCFASGLVFLTTYFGFWGILGQERQAGTLVIPDNGVRYGVTPHA